jgi:hypothetical protein
MASSYVERSVGRLQAALEEAIGRRGVRPQQVGVDLLDPDHLFGVGGGPVDRAVERAEGEESGQPERQQIREATNRR